MKFYKTPLKVLNLKLIIYLLFKVLKLFSKVNSKFILNHQSDIFTFINFN